MDEGIRIVEELVRVDEENQLQYQHNKIQRELQGMVITRPAILPERRETDL